MTPKIFNLLLTSKNPSSSLISAGKSLVLDFENFITADFLKFIFICLVLLKISRLSTSSWRILESSDSLVSNLSEKFRGFILPLSSTRSLSRLTFAAIERSSTNFIVSDGGSFLPFEKMGQEGLGMFGLRQAPLKMMMNKITPKTVP